MPKSPVHWSFCGVWNESYALLPPKEVKARDYMWASELGGSFIDRFLKMNGTPYTNPPNFRSERKFEMGTLLENHLKQVLQRLGLLKAHHRKTKYGLTGCLEVSGESDFICGGSEIDFAQVEKDLTDMELPHRTKERCFLMMAKMKEVYAGIILQEYGVELKSCSAFAMAARTRANRGYDTHELQAFHYSKGLHIPFKLEYFCKDDALMLEFLIEETNEDLLKIYTKDVETMTDFYVQKIMPPLDKEIQFDEAACNFSLNKKMEWSPYLSLHNPDYKEPEDFRNRWTKLVSSMDRVYKRCVKGDKMTKLNLDVIADARSHFKNWDDLVDLGKQRGILEEESETED